MISTILADPGWLGVVVGLIGIGVTIWLVLRQEARQRIIWLTIGSFATLILVILVLWVAGKNGEVPPPIPSTVIPVGTIVPYFGLDEDLPSGWVLCDGRDNPTGSQIRLDANSEKGGIQLPDLRSKFIRGSKDALSPNRVQEGGSDTTNLEHAHLWAHFGNIEWDIYNQDSDRVKVDPASKDGMSYVGKGYHPLVSCHV